MDILLVRTLPRPPAATDQEELPGAENFALDHDAPWVPLRRSVPWSPRLFTDDEVYGPSYTVDQEEPWRPAVERVPWSPRLSADDEHSAPLKNFPLDDDGPWVPLARGVPWAPRAVRDDEALGPLVFCPLDDEPWLATFGRIPRAAPPATDDEVFGSARGLDSEEPSSPAGRALARPAPRGPHDDETGARLANFALDHDGPWVPLARSVPWSPRAARDDEAGAPLANLPLDDEHAPPWARTDLWRPVAFRDDEAGAPLSSGPPELEEPWTARFGRWRWAPAVRTDDEALGWYARDDEAGVILRVRRAPWLLTVLWDDEVGCAFVVPTSAKGRVVYLCGIDRSAVSLSGVDRSAVALAGTATEQSCR